MELQFWRVHYIRRLDGSPPDSIDIVSETADGALKEALKVKTLGWVFKVEDIAGLRPLNKEQEGRPAKSMMISPRRAGQDMFEEAQNEER